MKEKVFPPTHTEGGVRLPYVPDKEEMEKCEYAKEQGATCPRKEGKRQFVAGGHCPLIDCASCPYQSADKPITIEVEETSTMSADAIKGLPHRTIGPGDERMPEDAHERIM